METKMKYFETEHTLNSHGYFRNEDDAKKKFPLGLGINIHNRLRGPREYIVSRYTNQEHEFEGKRYKVIGVELSYQYVAQGEGRLTQATKTLRSLYAEIKRDRSKGEEVIISRDDRWVKAI